MADTDRVLWEEDPDPEAQPEAAPQAEPEAALEAEPLLRQPWADDPDETALRARPGTTSRTGPMPRRPAPPPAGAGASWRRARRKPCSPRSPPPRTLWPVSTPGRKPRRIRCAAG